MAMWLHLRFFRRAGRGLGGSPLLRRILIVNSLPLFFLVAGLLYLDQYREALLEAELDSLTVQGEMIAAALGEAAIHSDNEDESLMQDLARQMVRRLSEPVQGRVRLFSRDGGLVADSSILYGPFGAVEMQDLPPPGDESAAMRLLKRLYDRVTAVAPSEELPTYKEKPVQRAGDYSEVLDALDGEISQGVRALHGGNKTRLLLTVAVPVQRFKHVGGAVLLSQDGESIEQNLFRIRVAILEMFLGAAGITVLLSLYLAGTIARPLRRLALAAERVRHGHGRRHVIPVFKGRADEIGELASALKEMTEALWRRMDAIERFAADVAHEIKNPLTSMRSAIETAARIEDPERRRKLMAIVQEDIGRLDRLISDISDASRLDAELSRADLAPVALRRLLETLVDIHSETASPQAPRLELDALAEDDLTVQGMEGRLAQVLRNVIGNAVSFSPPGGHIWLRARRADGWVEIAIEDEGPGMPEDKLEAVFDRFYSERPKGEKFGAHSGLGLSISKMIAESHGGAIRAENRHGEDGRILGARFVLRLPVAGGGGGP